MNGRIIAQLCLNGRKHRPFLSHSYFSSAATSQDAYIALGSNLGDKVHNINAGSLSSHFVSFSSIYHSCHVYVHSNLHYVKIQQ